MDKAVKQTVLELRNWIARDPNGAALAFKGMVDCENLLQEEIKSLKAEIVDLKNALYECEQGKEE